MRVDGEEERRPVRDHGVQHCAVGPLRGEHVDAPAEAAYWALWVGLRERPDRLERVLRGCDLEIDAGAHERPEERVDVRLDEAGHEHPPGEVDDRAVRSGVGENLRVGADGDDAVARDRDRLRPGFRRIERVDAAIAEDGRDAVRRGRGGEGGAGQRGRRRGGGAGERGLQKSPTVGHERAEGAGETAVEAHGDILSSLSTRQKATRPRTPRNRAVDEPGVPGQITCASGPRRTCGATAAS